MVKISLSDRKFVVLVAVLFSGALAFVILRALLTNHGIIEAIDIQWNQNFAMFEYFFHTWNFYNNGSNIIFASQFPIYGWVLVFRDVALAQRFVYFLIVSLISFNMFLVTFYTLKRSAQKNAPILLGSIVASLIYTLNPLVFSEIFHISFLWAYSLFPLVFYFGWESFNTSSRRKVLVSALSLSMFFAFMADAWGMLVGLLILIIVAISSAIMNGRKNLLHRFVPNFLLTLLIMGIFTVMLAAYWLLPYITQRASGPSWDPFSMANLVSNSQYSGLTNIFGLHSWSAQPFFAPPIWWSTLTLLLPIVAVSAVLVRRNKLTLTLSSLLVVGLFLATGVKYAGVSGTGVWPPFGDLYLWLTFYSPRVISVQSFLLKYPYLFLAMASLAVAVLSAVLVTELFGRVPFSGFSLRQFSTKSHGVPIVLFFSIISLIALVGAPLLTGNLNGALSPVTLPDQYKELNAFFSSQNGPFRVMYVPQEANFNWSANPWANKIEYWGSGATPLMYGWGISASPNTGFLGDLVYDYLLTNQTQYLGKLLALGNVRYIVFHNDSKTCDPASAYPAFEFFSSDLSSFLKSSEYNDYYLKITSDSEGTGYLYAVGFEEYKENYINFSEYQNLLNSYNKELLDSINASNSPQLNRDLNTNITNKFNIKFDDLYVSYVRDYESSAIYNNLGNTREYLNSSLNSEIFQDYLNTSSYQKFMNSPNYNSTHDYLNSLEYQNFTASQYFHDSLKYLNFINSSEYQNFLYYFLIYHFQSSSQNADYQTYLSYNAKTAKTLSMFNNLQSQRDLRLVPFSNDSLFVFENTERMNYYQAYSKANIVVGGLDAVGSLSSIGDFYLNDSAFLFVENQHMSESNLASILNLQEIDKNLLFYDSNTFDDLVLDTIDTGEYIAPGEIFVNTSTDWWLSNSVTSYSWTPITLGNYMGEKYDFGLGHNLLYTTNVGAAFDLPVEIGKSDEYSIWLRLLFSPDGGNMTISINNSTDTIKTDTINTASSVLNGFNWVNLSNVSLTSGSHLLRVTSEGGLNAVNLVALPTVTEFEEHLQNLTNLINQSNVRIVYIMDKTFLSSAENNDKVSIFVPYPSSYIISFQANQSLTRSPLNLTVDNKVQSVFSANSFSDTKNWYSAGPFNFSQGYHCIDFSSLNIGTAIVYSVNNANGSMESLNSILGGGAEPYVVSYEKSDPVSFSVVVNSTKPFILSYQEPYDEFWESNTSASRIIINSVNNGYFIDGNLNDANEKTSEISITYTPEGYLQWGIKISIIAFILTTMSLVLILLVPRFRKKKPLLNKPNGVVVT
jgi:hypothetical protein